MQAQRPTETPQQRHEAAKKRVEAAHRERASRAPALVAEIAKIRTKQWQFENQVDERGAAERIGAIENELADDGFSASGRDLRLSPVELQRVQDAEDEARGQRMDAAHGIAAELARHSGVRDAASAAGDTEKAARATDNVLHCESELRRVLGPPDSADLDQPGLIEPAPEPPPWRRWQRPKRRERSERPVITDPARDARQDRREAEGLPRDHEPGFFHELTPGRFN